MADIYYKSPLLNLPLELLLKISGYLSFSDLWYLATVSRRCKSLSYQIISNKYRLDLSRPQLNTFNHILHSALAHIDRFGYTNDAIDHTVLQSVSNRLAVEFYDRSPLKNWEPCLDFFLDKTLGITLDHVLLDASLDIVPNLPLTTDVQTLCYNSLDENSINSRESTVDFFPTRKGRLITAFLTTLFPTITALFDTEKTTEIHHRLLLNHINRHLDSLINRYHSHHKQRVLLDSSLNSIRAGALAAAQYQSQIIRLRFRILIRFVGTLVQTELLSPVDLNLLTRQRIQAFFLTPPPPPPSPSSPSSTPSSSPSSSPSLQNTSKVASVQIDSAAAAAATTAQQQSRRYNILWLDDTEFQMSILLDMMRALLSLHSSNWDSNKELHVVTTLLNNTVSALSNKKETSVIPPSQPSKKSNSPSVL